jgi:pyroglutamyl-peptidase
MKRILVTGFKPFLTEPINPTELLVHELATTPTPGVDTLILPVSYHQAFATLKSHWALNGPYEALLMLGQAGGRKAIALERVALNWSETKHPDEEGFQFPVGPVVPHAPSSYISEFFPTTWKDVLSEIAAVEVSHSAGTYVCNALYFQALHELPKNVNILFAHVPYLPEQVKYKAEEKASMDFQNELRVIQKLIQLMQEF